MNINLHARMQLLIKVFLFAMLCIPKNGDCQMMSIEDVPKIDLNFFRGAPPADEKYAAKVFTKAKYRYNAVKQPGTNEYKLNFKVTVTLDSARSYFTKTDAKTDIIQNLLKHEQGHVLIAFIICRRIEQELSNLSYSAKYDDEAREKFEDYYQKFNHLQSEYDDATNHNIIREAQLKWDEKIAEMFRETFGDSPQSKKSS